MTRTFTCSLCNNALVEQPITYVKDNKIWTVNVLLCKNEKCVIRRGGTWVEYKTEMQERR